MYDVIQSMKGQGMRGDIQGMAYDDAELFFQTPRRKIYPKTVHQAEYMQSIRAHSMIFGLGPAGVGKTWLAVAAAIEALHENQIDKIILTRPVIEAGERLGFLPGAIKEKIDPYLRPIYDALYDMLKPEEVQRYQEQNIIEIAPLAYMRGRTLKHAFIIVDEAQNTTKMQMKMILTRLGKHSRMVINGDLSQTDLPHDQESGLNHAMQILQKIDEIHWQYFDEHDVQLPELFW